MMASGIRGKMKENTQITLKRHKGKMFECESCDKSFKQKGNLKNHIHTIHNGYKDHNCEYCGKSLTRANVLKKHINTVHNSYKDHKCDYCGKSLKEQMV